MADTSKSGGKISPRVADIRKGVQIGGIPRDDRATGIIHRGKDLGHKFTPENVIPKDVVEEALKNRIKYNDKTEKEEEQEYEKKSNIDWQHISFSIKKITLKNTTAEPIIITTNLSPKNSAHPVFKSKGDYDTMGLLPGESATIDSSTFGLPLFLSPSPTQIVIKRLSAGKALSVAKFNVHFSTVSNGYVDINIRKSGDKIIAEPQKVQPTVDLNAQSIRYIRFENQHIRETKLIIHYICHNSNKSGSFCTSEIRKGSQVIDLCNYLKNNTIDEGAKITCELDYTASKILGNKSNSQTFYFNPNSTSTMKCVHDSDKNFKVGKV